MDAQAIGLARRAYNDTHRAMVQRASGLVQAAEVNEARAEESVRSMVRDYGVSRDVAEGVLTSAECGEEWADVLADLQAVRAEGGAR